MARRSSFSTKPSPALQYINSSQKTHGLKLTTEAKRMLTTPLRELQKNDRGPDWKQVQSSLDLIFNDISANDGSYIRTHSGEVTSRLVMRAIQRLWCNIPPFCGPAE